MKTLIFIFLLLCVISCISSKGNKVNFANQVNRIVTTKAIKDTAVADTIAYIQSTFVDNKDKYIGRRLQILLDDLKLSVCSYTTEIAPRNRYIVPGISLSFQNRQNISYRVIVLHNKPAILYIKWTTPLPADSAHAILQNSTSPGEWSEAEKQYYGKQIVKDFGLVNWEK